MINASSYVYTYRTSKNCYCFLAEPYNGKAVNQSQNHNSDPEVVSMLSKLEISGRNITKDIKFTTTA